MNNNNEQRSSRHFAMVIFPWINWGIATLFYCHQYFLRVSISDLGPSLVKNFHINATTLGSVAATFYYAFMAMQLIAGVLLDRYGPRLMLTIAALMCAVSGVLFAVAENVYVLEISRLFAGAGAAFSWIGVLTLTRTWFSPKQFALVTGITVTVGTLGAVLGEGPLAKLLAVDSWREIMLYAGVVAFVLAIFTWFIVRDRPAQATTGTGTTPSLSSLAANLGDIVKNSQIWIVALYGGFLFVPVNAFAAMWCGPFLMAVYHVSLQNAEFAATINCQ